MLGFDRLSGLGSLITGAFVVFLLLVCNIIWMIYGTDLYRRGESHLPPHSRFLQKKLYSAPELKKGIENSSLFGSFDSWERSGESDTSNHNQEEFFTNKPVVTATVGKRFKYDPGFSGNQQPELSVISGPDGFRLNEGKFIWTPDESQVGNHTIRVGARDEEGTVHTASFNLHVSKYYYLLGTDERGRDIAGLLIEGSRWTLVPGFIAAFTSIFLGVLLGAVSGYYPGKISNSIDFSVQVLESMPGLLLFFLTAVIFRFNIYWVMLAVGLSFAPVNVKLIRAMVRKFVRNQFVEASKELGFREQIVLWRDIIWVNGKASIAAQASYCFAFAILAEVTLSYLQIGVQASDGVSWGTLLYQGRGYFLDGYYWILVFPGLAIIVSILGFYLLGDGLGKVLDYREVE